MEDKKQKPPSIRDFPTGCGPRISTHKAHVAASSSEFNMTKNVPERSRLSAARVSPPNCGEKISEVFRQNHDCPVVRDYPVGCGPSISTAKACVAVAPSEFDAAKSIAKSSRPSTIEDSHPTCRKEDLARMLAGTSKGQKRMQDYKGKGISDCNRSIVERSAVASRDKVRKALRLFQVLCRVLLQEEEARTGEQGKGRNRVDLKAARILKENRKYVNEGKQIIGPIPGIEVGDEFHYRMELNVIGLHRPSRGGIDYMKQGDKILATSIVASGIYDDDLDNADFLIYTGSGGNVINPKKEPKDQKLERGNLALINSYHVQNYVRVIRGFKSMRAGDSSNAKIRLGVTYTYDGLYLVEKWHQELGPHGKLVFKYLLRRIPGQPELAWKKAKKSINSKTREGLCARDISQRREPNPICAVNTVDIERPPEFRYTTGMIYSSWFRPSPAKGCNCTDGCFDVERCSCAGKNGGEVPYNYDGALVKAKPLIYECGPSCCCPPSCRNRVSQHGIKLQLEIFKTRSTGWGVRSLTSIPSGSFVCEYAGELLGARDAEKRTGNEDYLFDVGINDSGSYLWEGLSTLMPKVNTTNCEVVEDCGFTIDATQYGNVGRFINHSCSPNLYVQYVLYDHEDKRIPHVMLFAAENVPPLEELTYHYNFSIDERCKCRRMHRRS